MQDSEHYEQLLAFIATHVPAPFTQEEVDDAVVFTGGSPGEVIVRLTESTVIVEEYAVQLQSRSVALKPRRIGAVKWRRLPESALMTIVGELIKGARDARRARYRECVVCGRTRPPEWMAGEAICRSCADEQFGVVH